MELLEDKIISHVEQAMKSNAIELPTLPQHAIDIMSLEDEEELELNTLINTLEHSASISFLLFYLANLLTGNQHSKSYEMLIEQLGLEETLTQAASRASQQMMQPVQSMIDKALRVVTKVAYNSGRISAQIAKRHTSLSPDLAKLSGLFHCIGALPIIAYASNYEADIQDSITFEKTIQSLHSQISVTLLEHGNFDPHIIAAAKDHKDTNREIPEADYTDIVQVASLLSQRPHGFDEIRQLKSSHRLGMSDYSDEQFQTLIQE